MRKKRSYTSIVLLLVILQLLFFHEIRAQSDSIKSKKVNFSIYPVFGYQPETRFTFGVISFFIFDVAAQENDEYHRPSIISPYLLYTLNNQILIAIDFDMYLKNGYYLDIKPRYYKYPDFFFGIGNNNNIEDKETYTNEFVGRFEV